MQRSIDPTLKDIFLTLLKPQRRRRPRKAKAQAIVVNGNGNVISLSAGVVRIADSPARRAVATGEG